MRNLQPAVKQSRWRRFLVVAALTLVGQLPTASLSFGLAAAQTVGPAQSGLRPLALGRKNSVSLRLPTPSTGLPAGGFVVTRQGPGGSKTVTIKPAAPEEVKKLFGVEEETYAIALGMLKALATASQEERGYLLLNLLSTLRDPALSRALGLLYEDKDLAAGSYTYTVTADKDNYGSVKADVGQDKPLPAPGSLQIKPSVHQVTLTWQRPTPDTFIFQVQRAVGSGNFENLTGEPMLVNRGATPQQIDQKIDPKQTYRYRVIALDIFGRESAPSAEVTLKGSATLPLSAPVIALAKGEQGQVTLGWAATTNPNVKEIIVLRGEHPGKPSVLTKLPATATGYTDKTGTLGEHMYYSLKVSDGSNTSAASPEVTGRAYNETPSSAPTALKAVPDDDNITLSWAKNPERDIYGYNIYRAELGLTGDKPLVRLNGDTLKATTYTDKLKQGMQSQYQYIVRAVNTSGVEGLPSAPVTSALIDKTPPDVPLLLRAQAGSGASATSIALVFTLAPTLDLKEFQVYRAAGDEQAPDLIATLPASSFGYLDSKLRPGLLYSYAVVAVDNQGNKSPASNVMSARTGAAKLGAPGGLNAVIKGNQVQLSWSEQAGAAGYYVFRTLNGKRLQVAGPLDAAAYQDDLRKGARYSVQAVSSTGALGPMSAEVEAR